MGSSADKKGSTLQNAYHPHEGLVTHQLIEQLLVTCVEHDLYYLEQHLQPLYLLRLLHSLEDCQQTRKQVAFREEDGSHTLVPLVLGDVFELSQNLVEVIGSRIGHFILEVEVDALRCRHRDCVFTLVLLYELPEGICTELLLETDSHDLILADLCPLDSV